jgi:hypothetical protein
MSRSTTTFLPTQRSDHANLFWSFLEPRLAADAANAILPR